MLPVPAAAGAWGPPSSSVPQQTVHLPSTLGAVQHTDFIPQLFRLGVWVVLQVLVGKNGNNLILVGQEVTKRYKNLHFKKRALGH